MTDFDLNLDWADHSSPTSNPYLVLDTFNAPELSTPQIITTPTAIMSPTDVHPPTSSVDGLSPPSNTSFTDNPSLSEVSKALDVVLVHSDDTPPSSADQYTYKRRPKIGNHTKYVVGG